MKMRTTNTMLKGFCEERGHDIFCIKGIGSKEIAQNVSFARGSEADPGTILHEKEDLKNKEKYFHEKKTGTKT